MKQPRRILKPVFNEGNQAMTTTRIERDCLGTMEIPDDRYYGIQTNRMVKVSGYAHLPVIFYPGMHRALFRIKKACALANAEIVARSPRLRELSSRRATARSRANSTRNSRSTCGRAAATPAST